MFFSFTLLARAENPSQVLEKFMKSYLAKDFESASKYLSLLDIEYLEQMNKTMAELAQRSGSIHTNITLAQLLKRSWESSNDPEQKKKIFDQMSKYFSSHPDKYMKNEDLMKKFETLKKISIDANFVLFSGKVIKEEIKKDYAIVLGDSYIEYPESVLNDAKEFYKTLGKKEGKEREKHVKWIGRQYHFPSIFLFVKEKNRWKIIFFNRKNFPKENFSEIFKEYETQ